MSEHVKLGYIGLGNMGAPMAKRLVEWPGGVTVFDVRTEAMTPLAEKGATPGRQRGRRRGRRRHQRDGAQRRAGARGGRANLAANAKPGTVIAIHSTISRRAPPSNWPSICKPQGIHVVDAPVSGGGGAAKKGELAVMVGAER